MANIRTYNLVELKIKISVDEEQRFNKYVEQKKFSSPRLAFGHLLHLAEKAENGEDGNEEVEEPVPVKEDAKKGKGRKGKKGAEEPTASDGEKNGDTNGHDAEAPEAAKVVDEKKAKGRKGKKDTNDVPLPVDSDDGKNGDHPGENGEDDVEPKQAGNKRAPPKKTTARKGKLPVMEEKHDATFNMAELDLQEAAPKPPTPKKSGRGKKAKDIEALEDPENGAGDAIEMEKGKSPKAANADMGNGATDTKKRRGKTDKGDDNEPAAPNPRSMKKMTSESSVTSAKQNDLEHQDDQAGSGETKKGGKRKPVNNKGQEAAAAVEPAEATSTAAKPKRGRVAKKDVNYADTEKSF